MRELPRAKVVALWTVSLFLLFLLWGIAPSRNFPTDSIITVPAGSGLYSLSQMLEERNVISSPFWFRNIAILLGGERAMKAGEYYFSQPQNSIYLAWRIVRGKYEIETLKITIPEGFTVEKISDLFGPNFIFFDNRLFVVSAPEGYLFPDTYFIPVTATASSTIKLLRDNFLRKIFPIMPEVEMSGKSLEDIIIIASLIEGEANNQEDREMVSNVLWKRLKMGMPLQVDVELKTYEFQGLPEKPINNPGLASIKAAIYPTTTPYLYYLTGHDDKMHYAKTFDEHKNNISKYLSN